MSNQPKEKYSDTEMLNQFAAFETEYAKAKQQIADGNPDTATSLLYDAKVAFEKLMAYYENAS